MLSIVVRVFLIQNQSHDKLFCVLFYVPLSPRLCTVMWLYESDTGGLAGVRHFAVAIITCTVNCGLRVGVVFKCFY